MTLPHRVAQRVLRRERSGSSSPVVVQTESDDQFVKLRGAAQGPAALVAELIVADFAEMLGLAVPTRSLVDLPAAVPSEDVNDELRDLLDASVGENVGFAVLDGARNLTRPEYERVPLDIAASVLWLDILTQNLDRSPANPNVMVRKGVYWLIDHGAALSFQHDWSAVREETPHRVYDIARHVFGWAVPVLADAHAPLSLRITRDAIAHAVSRVPASLFVPTPVDVARHRAMYVAYLWKRAQWMPRAVSDAVREAVP
jgi:hypothetical protein